METEIVIIIIVILILIWFYRSNFGTKLENFDPEAQNTKVVLFEDYRNETPSYIYDSPKKIDVILKTNLKSAMISTGNHTVEIWRIWDSVNSNSTSINSDTYAYIVPYAMLANPAKYQLVAKLEPDTTKKIDFVDQINRIRLIIK